MKANELFDKLPFCHGLAAHVDHVAPDGEEWVELCAPVSWFAALLSGKHQGERALRRYQHWKGGIYEVLGHANHHEDLSAWTIYRKVGTQAEFIRPLEEFYGTVEVDGKPVLRFVHINREQTEGFTPYPQSLTTSQDPRNEQAPPHTPTPVPGLPPVLALPMWQALLDNNPDLFHEYASLSGLRVLLRWHHQRVMAVVDEIETVVAAAQKPLQQAVIVGVREALERLAPLGGNADE